MLAMQYNFTLPADYDMEIIRRRITAKGPLIDGLPGLGFKAYLYALRGVHGPENLYSPFYLWHEGEAMGRFFGGDIFAGVTSAFGWPSVKVWSVLHAATAPAIRDARQLSREIISIAPHTAMAELRETENNLARSAASQDGVLGVITAFEPTAWTLVRARLWREGPTGNVSPDTQVYEVGYLGTGGKP
jgi:hypothetical protein